MRRLALYVLLPSLCFASGAFAQDNSAAAAPATPTAPAAPADQSAPSSTEAGPPAATPPAGEAAPATAPAPTPAPAPTTDTSGAPVDATAPPSPAAAEASNPLAGVRDLDYISGLGNYVKVDRKRGDVTGFPGTKYGAGASVIFGRHFGNGWGWEGNYTFSDLETGGNGGGDFYLHQLGGDLTYSFGDRQHFTPFLLVGGGGILDDVHPRTDGGGSGYVDGGLGMTTGTFWHNRIRLRGEVRAIHDFISTPNHTGFTDYRAGLGIEIPFYELKPVQPQIIEQPTQVVKTEEIPWGLRDDDGDGVVNEKDKCPNTPPNTRVDGDGCPIPKVVRLEGVTFEFNKTRLRPDSQTILNWVVGIMQKYPDMQVELAGYTDSIGSAAYNLKLSQRRAESVKEYLLEKGIDAARVQAKGYGKENPVATNKTDEGRERNRRVELHILN
jgi:OmpA-OmpF porin, OOP family